MGAIEPETGALHPESGHLLQRGITIRYDLDHLTGPPDQAVRGPVQDDEALLLYALCRVMLVQRVLEIGGLNGYSARNFCQAVGPKGMVYTVDLKPVPKVAWNHHPIVMDVRYISPEDLGGEPLDLVFFDCHDYDVQMAMLRLLDDHGLIIPRTVLVLHDTNLHPHKTADWVYEVDGGWVHQSVERRMVNQLHSDGWDAMCLDTDMAVHDATLPFRHGLTLMRRFAPLRT